MDSIPEIQKMEDRRKTTTGIIVRAIQVGFSLALLAAILFLSAGDLSWPWAWTILGIYLASILINGAFLLRLHPETAAERGRPPAMKGWDKLVSGFWALFQFLGVPLIVGLDYRWGWSAPSSLAWHLGGALLFALGLGLFGWGMISNAYFSTVVRIQNERGQMVCDRGPYRLVRHPGYLGTILQSIGMPLLAGSAWALIPGMVAILMILIRTGLEDRFLQAELAGYGDYARRVRYRILPGVW